MNPSLVNGLSLIRAACAQLRALTDRPDQAATLEAIRRMLGELLAKETTLPVLERAVAKQLSAASGSAESEIASTTYAGSAGAARTAIRALATTDSAEVQRYVRAVAAIELAHAQVADQAVTAQLNQDESTGRSDAGLVVDTGALQQFLTTLGEANVEILEAKQVARGMSKRTVLVTLRGNRRLPDVIALRIDRRAEDNYLGTTVIDEFPALQYLWAHGAPIPQPHALESTGRVLGDPFVVFSSVGGAPVGGNYTAPPPNPTLMADIAARLAQIHAVPAAGFPRAPVAGQRRHIDEEIDRSHREWRELDEPSPAMELAFRWVLDNRQMGYGPPCVVHNDFNFNNILVADGRVTAVLDWEFVHVGTAAADIGYLYYSAQQVSSFEHFLTAYAGAGGVVPNPDLLTFYTFWGQLRLAVMAFQGVRHLDAGRFNDVRFAIAWQHRRSALLRVTDQLKSVGWCDAELAATLRAEFGRAVADRPVNSSRPRKENP